MGAENRDGVESTESTKDGKKLRVVIIGGSVAGLSCAHALIKSGACASITVLEKARSLTAAGAGVGVDYPSQKALQEWGLGQQFFNKTVPMNGEKTRAIDNEKGVCVDLLYDEYPDEFRHQAIHWSELHRILFDALPAGIFNFGHEVVSLEQRCSVKVTVSVTGPDETNSTKGIFADLVVAADGSMSRTRQLYSPNEKGRYAGYCGWRGVLDYSDKPEIGEEMKRDYPGIGENLFFELAPGAHTVLYELKGKRCNWVWYINQPEPTLKGKSLTKTLDEETIAEMHKQADKTWMPALAKVMKLTPDPFMNAIYDKDPLNQLAWGKVVLVGESAHPTVPHGMRATNMSIVDAYVLGKCFEKWGAANVNAAIDEYQNKRLAPTTEHVLNSRHLGKLKQGLSFEPVGSFPWPTAEKTTAEELLLQKHFAGQVVE